MDGRPTERTASGARAGGVSAAALVLANLLPLVGVLALGWEVFQVLVLYWLENVVVGVFAVGRIALARGPAPRKPGSTSGEESGAAVVASGAAQRLVLVPFFCLHYGVFTMVHGIFVFALFGGVVGFGPLGGLETGLSTLDSRWLALAVTGLAVSHGLSFWRNYYLGGEYLTLSPQEAMAQPYGRVVVLHLTILFGGFLVLLLGSPVWALLLLVALKTGLDLRAHLAERRKAGLRTVADGAAAEGGGPGG